jgi:hypothetical protein
MKSLQILPLLLLLCVPFSKIKAQKNILLSIAAAPTIIRSENDLKCILKMENGDSSRIDSDGAFSVGPTSEGIFDIGYEVIYLDGKDSNYVIPAMSIGIIPSRKNPVLIRRSDSHLMETGMMADFFPKNGCYLVRFTLNKAVFGDVINPGTQWLPLTIAFEKETGSNMKQRQSPRSFFELTSELNFGIYTQAPDSSILPFLKNHFPYLAKPPEKNGWISYPPGIPPEAQHGFHSIQVNRHPSIKTRHTAARLDLFTQEWPEGAPGLINSRVWIYFNNLVDAKKAQEELVNRFKGLGSRIEKKGSNEFAPVKITDTAPRTYKAEFIQLKLQKQENKYALLILMGNDNGEPW